MPYLAIQLLTLLWMIVATFLSLSTRYSCPTYLAIQLLILFWMMVAAFLSLSTGYSCPTWPSSP